MRYLGRPVSDGGTFTAYLYAPFSGSYEGSPFVDDYGRTVTISVNGFASDFTANPIYPPMTYKSITIDGVGACSGEYVMTGEYPAAYGDFPQVGIKGFVGGRNSAGDFAVFRFEYADSSSSAVQRARTIKIGYALGIGACIGQVSGIGPNGLNVPTGLGTMTKIQ